MGHGQSKKSPAGRAPDLKPRVQLRWAGERPGQEPEAYLPPMDIYELGDSLIIELELSGVKREAIDLFVERNLIVVDGVKTDFPLTASADAPKVSYLQLERKFGRFHREIELPVTCDTNEVRAKFSQGILVIELKKIQEQRGRRRRVAVE